MSQQRLFLPVACLLASFSAHAQANVQTMHIENHAEKTFTMTLEAPEHKKYCHARVSFEYSQQNTLAETSGTVDTRDCAAASGQFMLSARIRTDAGEIRILQQEKEWSRSDDQPVNFAGEFEIGENVDLVRVNVRGTKCICTETENDDTVDQTQNQGDKE